MAVDGISIKYHRTDDSGNVIEIMELAEDYVNASVRRTGEVKNNSADITVANPLIKYIGTMPIHRWVNDDGSLIFKTPRKPGGSAIYQNEEKIEIFAKAHTQNDAIDTTATSPDRLFTGFINEIEGEGSDNHTHLKLKLKDRNSILLNNVGVGIYNNTYSSGTATGVSATTLTDGTKSWTTNELKGKVLIATHGATDYRYTIISNTATVITVRPDDDISGDGVAISDVYVVSWTTPSIIVDQVLLYQNRVVNQSDKIIAAFDFESSSRYKISAIGTYTLTMSGASYTANSLKGRYGFITSGVGKGHRFNIKSNTTDTITVYGDTDLTTLGVVANTDYLIIAGLTSGVETMRPDGSAYPSITFAKAFKPLYEWFNELCEVKNTNTTDELTVSATSLVISRPLTYHVSPSNVLYVFATRDSPELIIDTTKNAAVSPDDKYHRVVAGRKPKNKVADSTNFIIFRYKDFDGVELLDYEFNALSGAPVVKDCYKPYFTVSNELINASYNSDKTKAYKEIDAAAYGANINALAYDGNSYPVWWSYSTSDVMPATEQAYKDMFEIEANYKGHIRAQSDINISGTGKWESSIPLDFEIIEINTMVKYYDYPFGINGVIMRVKDISYNMNKNSFRTSITIKEDEDEYAKSEA